MDPDAWWQTYVVGTHVRNAATIQQSFRNEAWADSLGRRPFSPRVSYRAAPSRGGIPSRGSTAPSTPRDGSRPTTTRTPISPREPPATPRAQRHSLRSAKPGSPRTQFVSYPTFKQYDPSIKPPAQMRDAAVQASPRVDILRIEATREAPILDPKNLPDDIRPATDEEVVKAQKDICDKFNTRFVSLRRAFRIIDVDASGGITPAEFQEALLANNLHTIREPVVDRLFSLMNVDGDGRIDYLEFCRLLTSDDVFNMKKIAEKVDHKKALAIKQLDEKQAKQEEIARAVGMTVDQYCEYFKISEIKV